MSQTVHVRVPARLHFGMCRFGHDAGPQFGGVGMMVEPPAVELSLQPAANFQVRGPLAERVEKAAESVFTAWRLAEPPPCEIFIQQTPEEHVGLGTGTQLSLGVAAGLARFCGRSEMSATELARTAGRGRRSAVGTHGFLQGGLIVDGGKTPSPSLPLRGREGEGGLGKLITRLSVPDVWRIVLIRSTGGVGLSGNRESRAFANLPPVPESVTNELWHITRTKMLPALARADCAEFGEAVYRFGTLAGDCFATLQGGPFATPAAAKLVDAVREFGVPGVGQSSWGPTLFAITESQHEAESLVNWLRPAQRVDAANISIAQPNNSGATID